MIKVYAWPTPNGHKAHIMLEECGSRVRSWVNHGIDWADHPQLKR